MIGRLPTEVLIARGRPEDDERIASELRRALGDARDAGLPEAERIAQLLRDRGLPEAE